MKERTFASAWALCLLILLMASAPRERLEPKLYAADGAQGPTILVWYGDTQAFGRPGHPQRWANIVGQAYAPDGLARLRYRLNDGPEMELPRGPDGTRLITGGDYNIELDRDALVAHPGTNSVTIIATSNSGLSTHRTVTVRRYTEHVVPLPYSIDFRQLEHIGQLNQFASVVDGEWLLGDTGVRTQKRGYDRLIAVGDRNWVPDYEAWARVTLHDWHWYAGVGLAVGWQGHAGDGNPRAEWPLEALGWVRNIPSHPEAQIMTFERDLIIEAPLEVLENTTYDVRVRSERLGGGLARFAFKMWPTDSGEPTAWALTYDVPERSGSVLLVAHHANVTWHEVNVTPLGENQPPVFMSQPLRSIPAESPYAYEIIVADPDPGSTLAILPAEVPDFLSLEDHGDGKATLFGRPPTAAIGHHAIRLRASDGMATTEQSFELEVVNPRSTLRSDSFASGPDLLPFWKLVGEPSLLSIEESMAVFRIPAESGQLGENGGNLQLLQEVSDGDFVIEARFSDVPSAEAHEHGIVAQGAEGHSVRLGTRPGSTGPRIVASVLDGSVRRPVASPSFEQRTPGSSAQHFRLERKGDVWRARFSATGSTWSDVATFSAPATITALGLYGVNDNAEVDLQSRTNYFLNRLDLDEALAFNRPPTFTSNPTSSVAPGEAYQTRVSATDPDDHPVLIEAIALPKWLEFSSAPGEAVLEGSPKQEHLGPHTVVLHAADPHGGHDLLTFPVLVTPNTVHQVASDRFEGVDVSSRWRLIDPRETSEAYLFSGTLVLSTAAGDKHDLWQNSFTAPRLLQQVPDADLVFQAEFGAMPEALHHMHGLLLQETDEALVRCGPYRTETGVQLLLATVRQGAIGDISSVPAEDPPRHIRLARLGNAMICDYSADAITWRRAGRIPHDLSTSAAGIFIGNTEVTASMSHRVHVRSFVGQENPTHMEP